METKTIVVKKQLMNNMTHKRSNTQKCYNSHTMIYLCAKPKHTMRMFTLCNQLFHLQINQWKFTLCQEEINNFFYFHFTIFRWSHRHFIY